MAAVGVLMELLKPLSVAGVLVCFSVGVCGSCVWWRRWCQWRVVMFLVSRFLSVMGFLVTVSIVFTPAAPQNGVDWLWLAAHGHGVIAGAGGGRRMPTPVWAVAQTL